VNDDEILAEGLRVMTRIRVFEDRVLREFAKGDMPGFVHTYHGAEPVAAGVCAHLNDADMITSTHRGHGHCIAKGCQFEPMVAELFGRETGLCKGRGGSMHIADFSRGILGANAIVGGGISLAVGGALASRVLGDGRVAVSFFGDGAANQGIFHESLNLAAIWRLPVVFVCENNGWAESTPTSYSTSVADIAVRARAYDIPGVVVDGSDYLDVYDKAGKAVQRARAGDGPTLIEAKITRMRGHFIGDPEQYRSREQRRQARGADPLVAVKARIDLGDYEHELNAELDRAYDAARAAPLPDPAELEHYVLSAPPSGSIPPTTPPPTEREGSYVLAVHEALVDAMRRDQSVIVVGEDVAGGAGLGSPLEGAMGGTFGVTKGMIEEFGPQRVLDTPISEAGFVGASVGAAIAGLRPVVDVMWSSFAPYCFDQIFNQAAKMRYMFGGQTDVPVVLRMAVGAGLRAGGHHSDTLFPIFVHIPGVKVVAPATSADAKGLLARAIVEDSPVIFLEHMSLYRSTGPLPEEYYELPIGVASVVQPGDDVTLIAASSGVPLAIEAAATLRTEHGVSTEVVDLRTLSPLDVTTLATSVGRTGRAVVIDESPPRCSIASEVAAVVTEAVFADLRAPIGRVTSACSPVPFSPALEDAHRPTIDKVIAAVVALD
jgi:2-oxoisovalerate dehydrogenase E1 component